jgi:hypothetical protein
LSENSVSLANEVSGREKKLSHTESQRPQRDWDVLF